MRPTGHVAHCEPGAIMLTAHAVELLTAHLRDCRPANDPRTVGIIADLNRLSSRRPVSRDVLTIRRQPKRKSYVDTTEAAQRLGISAAGVRKRIQRGTLRATFDGKRWRIPTSQLGEQP